MAVTKVLSGEIVVNQGEVAVDGSETIATSEQSFSPYSFEVVGHAYDKPNFLAEEHTSDFIVYTGDVTNFNCTEFAPFVTSLAGIEHYIAPGNHDVLLNCTTLFNAAGYPSYHSFKKNDDMFIILSSNSSPWEITGVQLTWLTAQLAIPATNRFVFVHHSLPFLDSALDMPRPNSTLGQPGTSNFQSTVRPLLEARDNVYLFMGDFGVYADTYYAKVLNGVTYYGFGFGKETFSTSKYMRFNVDGAGYVSWETVDY